MFTSPLRTLLPAPPRTVHAISWKYLFRYRLVIFLFILLAAAAMVWALTLTTEVLFAQDVPGTLTAGHASAVSAHTTSYTLDYTYTVHSQSRSNQVLVSAPNYNRLIQDGRPRRPTTLTVRYFHLGPFSWVGVPALNSPWLLIVLWGLALINVHLFWTLTFDSHSRIRFRPARWRQLCRAGAAVPGTVTCKVERLGPGRPPYVVDFTYSDPRGRTRTGSTSVPTLAQFDAVREGGPVTVLLDPRHPRRAVAYECCPFTIEGARPADGAAFTQAPPPRAAPFATELAAPAATPTQLPPPPRRVTARRLIDLMRIVPRVLFLLLFFGVGPWFTIHADEPLSIVAAIIGAIGGVALSTRIAIVYWIRRARPHRLLMHGIATRGHITAKHEETTRERAKRGFALSVVTLEILTLYFVTVAYTDAAGASHTATVRAASRDLFRDAPVGQPVTVLYDPRRPDRPLVYELTTLRVANATPVSDISNLKS